MRRHNVQLKRTLSISVENYLLSCNNRVSLNFGKTSHVEFPLLQLSHPNGLNLVFCWTETFLFPRSSASFYITFSYLRGCLFSLLSCCLPTLLTMNAQLLKMLNIFIGINFHPPPYFLCGTISFNFPTHSSFNFSNLKSCSKFFGYELWLLRCRQ